MMLIRLSVMFGIVMSLASPARAEFDPSQYAPDALLRLQKGEIDHCAREVDVAAEAKAKGKQQDLYDSLRRYSGERQGCYKMLEFYKGPRSLMEDADKGMVPHFRAWEEKALKEIQELRRAKNITDTREAEAVFANVLRWHAAVDKADPTLVEIKKNWASVQERHMMPEEEEDRKKRKLFDAWYAKMEKQFNMSWEDVQKSENAARAAYEAGVQAFRGGDLDKAEAKLLEARSILLKGLSKSKRAREFTSYYLQDQVMPYARGLAYDVGEALLELYREAKKDGPFLAEFHYLRFGRPWMKQDEELVFRMRQLARGLSSIGQGDAKIPTAFAPEPPKDIVPLLYWERRGRDEEIKDFPWEEVDNKASDLDGRAYRKHETEGYAMDLTTSDEVENEPARNVGRTMVWQLNVKEGAAGGTWLLDTTRTAFVGTNCRETNRIRRIDPMTGTIIYDLACDYRKTKQGMKYEIELPKGVTLKPGDEVEFYTTVKKVKDKRTVRCGDTAFVSIKRDGDVVNFMGVPLS